METIFQIATSISTPLALAGLFASITFYVFRQIIASKAKSNALTTKSIIAIINRLFVLTFVAMVLGFIGWGLNPKKKIAFHAFKNGEAIEGLKFRAIQMGVSLTTDRDGKIAFEIDEDEAPDSVDIKFESETDQIDTAITLHVASIPERFRLVSPSSLYKPKDVFKQVDNADGPPVEVSEIPKADARPTRYFADTRILLKTETKDTTYAGTDDLVEVLFTGERGSFRYSLDNPGNDRIEGETDTYIIDYKSDIGELRTVEFSLRDGGDPKKDLDNWYLSSVYLKDHNRQTEFSQVVDTQIGDGRDVSSKKEIKVGDRMKRAE